METINSTDEIKIFGIANEDHYRLTAVIPRNPGFINVLHKFYLEYIRPWENCYTIPGHRFWYKPKIQRTKDFVIIFQDSALDI